MNKTMIEGTAIVVRSCDDKYTLLAVCTSGLSGIFKRSRISVIINAANYSASSVTSPNPFFSWYSLFPRASFSRGIA